MQRHTIRHVRQWRKIAITLIEPIPKVSSEPGIGKTYKLTEQVGLSIFGVLDVGKGFYGGIKNSKV